MFRANKLVAAKRRIKGFQIEFGSIESPELSLGYGTQAEQISALAIELIGPQADKYNVFYRAKIQNASVTPVSSNSGFCEHGYQSKQIDSLQARVESKP